jgi:hypothetical protein
MYYWRRLVDGTKKRENNMSEAGIPEVQASVEAAQTAEAPSKPKQYLIMADELHMAILGKIIPGILFVQVEGMAMKDNSDHMLLVNPIAKPAPETAPIEGVKADA